MNLNMTFHLTLAHQPINPKTCYNNDATQLNIGVFPPRFPLLGGVLCFGKNVSSDFRIPVEERKIVSQQWS